MDAEVTTPEGKTLVVPGFHEVPMRLETRGAASVWSERPAGVSRPVHADHGRDPHCSC